MMYYALGGESKMSEVMAGKAYVPGQSGSRLLWIDALRGFAAVMVLIHHYVWEFFHVEALRSIFSPGTFGVVLFFSISGFVIPHSIRKLQGRNPTRFVIGRLFRLYPAYWVSLPFASMAYGVSALVLLVNASMIQRFIGFPDAIGVYWTLQVEIAFYALIVLGVVLGRSNKPGMVSLFFALTLAVAIAFALIRGFLNLKAPVAVPLGLTVMFFSNIYYLHLREKFLERWQMLALSAFYALALVAIFYMAYNKDWGYGEHPERFIGTYGSALILFLFAAKREPLWSNPVLQWLGKISYSLYLFHLPIYEIVVRGLTGLGAVWQVLLATVVSLLIATLVYHFVEKPAIELGKRMFAGQRPLTLPPQAAPAEQANSWDVGIR